MGTIILENKRDCVWAVILILMLSKFPANSPYLPLLLTPPLVDDPHLTPPVDDAFALSTTRREEGSYPPVGRLGKFFASAALNTFY